MKALWITFLLSLTLISCGEKDNRSELKEEYDLIKPKVVKQEPKAPLVIPDPYKAGVEYTVIEKPYATDDKSHVVVYEFFGYKCPHCFYFEPFIDKWLAKKSPFAKLERVPLNFQTGWDTYQLGFLTAKMMGVAEKSHAKLFDAIHNNHKRFNTIEQLATWYATQTGIDAKKFISTADSFILDSQMRKADKMGFVMGVTATPTVVVNGKYKVSTKIRNRDEIISVVKFLVAKEIKLMGLDKKAER